MPDQEDIISEYVDRNGVRQDTDYMLANLNELLSKFKELQSIKVDFKGITSSKEIVATIKAQTEALKALEVQIRTNNKALLDEEKIRQQKLKNDQEQEKLAQQQIRTQQQITSASEKQQRQSAQEQKVINDIANDYKQLNLALKDAEDRYASLVLAGKRNTEEGKAALSTAMSYRKILSTIDEDLGNYKRRVGDYSSATRGLRLEVSQLLRETPNIGQSFQTFILAISNNLPLFFEAVDKVKEENASLKAEGQKTSSVFSQIGQALLSPISLLTVGVAIFTVFGDKIGKWVEGLFNGAKTLDNLKEKLAQFNKELEDSNRRLEFWLKYLDRLNEQPRVQLQIDNTNVPKLQQMRNELKELGDESVRLADKFKTTEEEFARQLDLQGKATNRFYDFASKKAQEAFRDGSIDGIMDKLSEQDKELYQSMKSATDAFAKINDKYADLNTAVKVDDLSRKLKQLQIDKELSDQERQILKDNSTFAAQIVKAKNDTILADEKSSFKERLAALRSNYEEENKIIAANLLSVTSDPTKGAAEINAAQKQAQAERAKNELDFQEKTDKVKEERSLRQIAAEEAIYTAQKQTAAKTFEEISAIESLSLQDRLQLLQNYANVSKSILDRQFEDEKKKDSYKFLTDEEKFQKEIEYETKVSELSLSTNKKITETLKAELDKQTAYRQESIDRLHRGSNSTDADLSESYTNEATALAEQFNKRLISQEQYQQKRLVIDKKYKVLQLQNVIDETAKELDYYKGAEQELEANELKLASLRQRLRDAKGAEQIRDLQNQVLFAEKEVTTGKQSVDSLISLRKKLSEAKKNLIEIDLQAEADALQKVKELTQDLINELIATNFAILNGSIERRKNAIQQEMDLLDKRKEKEIELVNSSVASEQDKSARINIINARAQAQKEALERKQRQLDQQKAKNEKVAQVASIAASTAADVAKISGQAAIARAQIAVWASLLNPVGVAVATAASAAIAAQIPLVVAIGAARIGQVLATPIPQYKHGTDNHPGGLAVVGDGGKSEMVVTPTGSIIKTPAVDTIMDLPKGSIVLSDFDKELRRLPMEQTNKIVNYSGKAEAYQFAVMTSTLTKELKRINKTISEKQETHVTVQHPLKSWLKQGENITEYLGRNI